VTKRVGDVKIIAAKFIAVAANGLTGGRRAANGGGDARRSRAKAS
jgi:hypothetical protein